MFNSKFLNFTKNFSYSLFSNAVSLIISAVVTLFIPKVIGSTDFGYWQVYLFYSSYTGFFHFGWNDGIYLRYGGEDYNSLDKKLFYSQFWMLCIFQVFLGITIISITRFIDLTAIEKQIIVWVSLNMVISNVKSMLQYTLQATNRIKEYSSSVILDRLIFLFFIIILIIFKINDYKFMIFADILGKFIFMIYIAIICKDIVFRKITDFKFNVIESVYNINAGINLMLANIVSNLIIGTVKFGIQRVWSVEVFGKVSLTLSISNMFTSFINAVSLVVFPMLRKIDQARLSNYYLLIRYILVVPLFGVLILFFPMKEILLVWLPDYSEGLRYMHLIFPIIIFETRVALLTNTFFKTLREEKKIVKVNSISLLLSVFFTGFFSFYLENLKWSILSILILLAVRSIYSEILLMKILKINLTKDLCIEIFLSIIFVAIGEQASSILGLVLYLIFYLLYLFLKRKSISNTFTELRRIIKK